MSKVLSIKEHLAARFDRHRLVIWRDPEGSYADDLDALTPPDVTALRVANDEFAIKYRVLRESHQRSSCCIALVSWPRGQTTGCSTWSWRMAPLAPTEVR